MKLQDQVCSLEQGKRLKELGVIDLSIHTWYELTFDNKKSYYLNRPPDYHQIDDEYPAFTVAELGVMLPDRIKSWRGNDAMGIVGFIVLEIDGEWGVDVKSYETEAQARAAMLIYLLENNLIEVTQVNNRLNQ